MNKINISYKIDSNIKFGKYYAIQLWQIKLIVKLFLFKEILNI